MLLRARRRISSSSTSARAAEFANGHIPSAHLIPVDELEERLRELPAKDATHPRHLRGGRPQHRGLSRCSRQQGFTRLLNLVGGMHAWRGPRDDEDAGCRAASRRRPGTAISFRGGTVSDAQVVAAIRECFDPEIPLNVYDLGLIYGIDIDAVGDRRAHDAHLGGLSVGAHDSGGREARSRGARAAERDGRRRLRARRGTRRGSARRESRSSGLA